MMLTRFPPGADIDTESREGFVYKGEQHGFVIEGSMELTLGDEIIIINSGDSFSYPTEIPHRLRNAIEEETVVIFTMTPVRINW